MTRDLKQGDYSMTVSDRVEILEDALRSIERWSRAYPVTVFSEPDLPKAHMALLAAGMTLDAVSAHAIRHAIDGVGRIAREALAKAGTQ